MYWGVAFVALAFGDLALHTGIGRCGNMIYRVGILVESFQS